MHNSLALPLRRRAAPPDLADGIKHSGRFASALAGVCLGFITGVAAAATTPCPAPFEPAPHGYDFLSTPLPAHTDAQFGQVHVTRLPVFDETDPAENNAIFRWGNRLHAMTREQVIRRLLLFESGAFYDPRLLQESARLLRDQRYLYGADIRVVAACAGEVDVEVITRDVWSFAPELSFDRAGGENTFQVGLRDSNFLGTGRLVSLTHKQDVDRDSTRFVFRDGNIAGSRLATRIAAVASNDGFNHSIGLERPFYALDTRRAWGVRVRRGEQEDTQYFRGDEISRVRERSNDATLSFGFSSGLRDGVARRWTFGFRHQSRDIDPLAGIPHPVGLAPDRELNYPFVLFERIEDDFAVEHNLDQIYRTEDLHLGSRIFARFGFAPGSLGDGASRLIADGFARNTLHAKGGTLVRHGVSWEGYWNSERRRAEDLLVEYDLTYFHRQSNRRAFVVSANALITDGLSSHRQVVLGGATGLRGFDNRFQTGHARFVVNVEQRYYTSIHVLQLARLGWAFFFDAGQAWDYDHDNGTRGEMSANVGLGLRLASTKAEVGRIVHIDLAFPLTQRGRPGVPGAQLVVNIKDSL